MRTLSYAEAIREGLAEEMRRDPKVFVFGEDVGQYGGTFKVTKGLIEEFGPERVIDSPLSENAIIGAATGAAIMGYRPVAEIMYMDFLNECGDQAINHLPKLHFMTGGKLKVPVVIRTQYSLVATPSSPADAKGLLKTAIRGSNPVLFVESAALYSSKGEVPEGEILIPFGRADVKLEGSDVTVVAISRLVKEAVSAGQELSAEGISIEVVDPKTLVPLDLETITASVKKTGRLITSRLTTGLSCIPYA